MPRSFVERRQNAIHIVGVFKNNKRAGRKTIRRKNKLENMPLEAGKILLSFSSRKSRRDYQTSGLVGVERLTVFNVSSENLQCSPTEDAAEI